ncbi:MAG: hypothetical protein R3F49_04820 [Planctomycetota bacterium]
MRRATSNRAWADLAAALVLTLALGPACARPAAEDPRPLPQTLAATGLFAPAAAVRDGVVLGEAPEGELALAAGVRSFTPQYPLWTDGAAKRRWIRLPEGGVIDARDPDAWVFPVGTKVWKELSFGRRVETRFMERRANGEWCYATYIWEEGAADAPLAPDAGRRGACETALGTRHDVPSRSDCRACHEAHPSRVLGFGALQLAPDRDPNAPHAEAPRDGDLDLVELMERGLLRGDRGALLAAGSMHAARPGRERAVLGYLHGNCAGCHNSAGPLATLGLSLVVDSVDGPGARATALGVASRFAPGGAAHALRVAPGDPDKSVLALRMASRTQAAQMPPLGTHAVDERALALVRAWISSDLATEVSVAFEPAKQP